MTLGLYLAVAAAGACGAVARAWVTRLVRRRGGRPGGGTLVVNLCGAFATGAVWAVGHALGDVSAVVIGTGFLGAFTTFSTWMGETAGAWRSGRRVGAVAEAIAVLAAGVGAAWLGVTLAGRA